MDRVQSRITLSLFWILLCAPISAQVTQRVNLSSSGVQANLDSSHPAISGDGRYVVFLSQAMNLTPNSTNGVFSVFCRDRLTGTTELMSADASAVQADGSSFQPGISADGRFVVFDSRGSNLVPGDTNGVYDVFLRDRVLGTIEMISLNMAGTCANNHSKAPCVTPDGRFVAFWSGASDLVPGDTNGMFDVFVRDRQNGTTERVSVDSNGVQGSGDPFQTLQPAISANGRYVVFWSESSNLVPGDTNGTADAFVRDRQNGTTERVSVDSAGAQSNGSSFPISISADGRWVGFASDASNLVSGDANGTSDVFVRDRLNGTTELVSVSSAGEQGNQESGGGSISDDGRFVAFDSLASNLWIDIVGDTNGVGDVFVHDRQSGTTELVSVASGGTQGNAASGGGRISADGRYVVFGADATNLVPRDTNSEADIFVRDRFGGTSFTELCDPGIAGVVACPCFNPPGALGRGCDNSSTTGGAVLSAFGGTYLSSDSLVFATGGETSRARSMLIQGAAVLAGGTVYGQGVRCAAGRLLRLYSKTASDGSITAPDFGLGDLPVSTRSASKGDVIQPGQSRWYFVFYRDPTVLGGCPATSTFNATQTGEVTWSP